MSAERNLILAIETAVGGGSISIRDRQLRIEIGSLIGNAEISKAEDVLENIERLLAAKKIDRKQFGVVALATGMGSATGLKIGAATAKGLAKGLDCLFTEICLWKVFAKFASDNQKGVGVPCKFYMPAGKGRCVRRVWQSGRYLSEGEIIDLDLFQSDVKAIAGLRSDPQIYIHEMLLKEVGDGLDCELIKQNLAAYTSKFASDNVTI